MMHLPYQTLLKNAIRGSFVGAILVSKLDFVQIPEVLQPRGGLNSTSACTHLLNRLNFEVLRKAGLSKMGNSFSKRLETPDNFRGPADPGISEDLEHAKNRWRVHLSLI